MAKVCTQCLRSPRAGITRSHSNIATKRRMMLNLQRRMVKGVQVLLCTSCIRTINKHVAEKQKVTA